MILSWPEIHGAVTHFPVAMLLATAAFEVFALLARDSRQRENFHIVSFWMLVTAVVTSLPSALSGYITANHLFSGPARPPAGFSFHWISAIVTSILSIILLWWRIKSDDRLNDNVRKATVALALLASVTVSVTGYYGGKLVFGDESEPAAPVSVGGGKTAGKVGNPVTPKLDPKVVLAGQKLFNDIRCTSCHRMDGKGATTAPDLTHAGKHQPDIKWQIEHLKNPQKLRPRSSMPAYDTLSPTELTALATYLVSKR